MSVMRMGLRVAAMLIVGLGSNATVASSPQKVELKGLKSWSRGKLEGMAVNPKGHLIAAPLLRRVAQDIPGPVTHSLSRKGQEVFFATASPARIWRLKPNEKPKKILELDRPVITRLAFADRNTLVALSGPEGGLHYVPIDKPWQTEFVPVADVHLLTDLAVTDFGTFVVGGGDEAVLLRVERKAQKVTWVLELEESILSLVRPWPGQSQTLLLGSGSAGRVFTYRNGNLQALYESEAAEVVDVVFPDKGNAIVAFAGETEEWSEGGTARDRKTDKASKRKGSKSPGMSEVVRLENGAPATVLWQSRKDQVHDLAYRPKTGDVLAATGPNGRVFSIDAAGLRAAAIWVEVPDHKEVTQLSSSKDGYFLTAAAPHAIWSANPSKTEGLGLFTSAVLDVGAHANVGHVSWRGGAGQDLTVKVRTGNSSNPNEGWAPYSAPLAAPGNAAAAPGRFLQAQVQINNAKGGASSILSQMEIHYLVKNRAPEIGEVVVSKPNLSTWRTYPSIDQSGSITFDKDAHEELPDSLDADKTPKMKGKIREAKGYRTFHAVAEDPDQDKMRYRFRLVRLVQEKQKAVQETPWSENPFWSLDTRGLASGDYQVEVDVDDVLSNGTAHAKTDSSASERFAVSNRGPTVERAQARAGAKNVKFRVTGYLQTRLVKAVCRIQGSWMPVVPEDGILDSAVEAFTVDVQGQNNLTCRFTDEAGNVSQEEVYSASF